MVTSTLDDVLARVRQTATRRLASLRGSAPWNAGNEAEDEIVAAVIAGSISAADCDAILQSRLRGAPQAESEAPEVTIALSEALLRAASLTGAPETARAAARAHAHATLEVVGTALDRRVSRLAGRSLNLAAATGLEDTDPDLVADLHLEAGNRHMRPTGPAKEEVYLGLRSFTAAYRLKVSAASPDTDRLADITRKAAQFTLTMADLAAAMPMGAGAAAAELRGQAALEAFTALGDAAGARAARLLLARGLVADGRVDQAQSHLTLLGGDTDRLGDDNGAAELALVRADMLLRSGSADAALDALEGALAAVAEQPASRWYGLTVRARALRALGRNDDAADAYRTLAGEVSAHLVDNPRELGARGRVANAQAQVGVLACLAGDLEEARERFASALDALTNLEQFEKLEVHRLAADALWDAGRLEEAGPHLDTACRLMMQLVGGIDDPARREGLREEWSRLEQRRVERHLRAGNADLAFDLAEELKGRELRGVVLGFGGEAAAVPADLAAAYGAVGARIAELEEHLAGLGPAGPAGEAVARELAGLRQRLDVVVQLAEREMMAARAAGADLSELVGVLRGEPQSAVKAADALLREPGTAVLSYLVTGGGIAVLVRRGGATTGRLLPTAYGRIAPAVRELANALGDGSEPVDALLARLGAALLDPVADLLDGVEHLILAPHRGLHALPWSCLGAPGSPLADRVASVSVVPSVLLAAVLGARPGEAASHALLVDRPCQRTPLATVEDDAVARLLPAARRISGADADPFRVAAASPGARLVHLACPAVPGPETRLQFARPAGGVVPVFETGAGTLGARGILGLFDLRACETVVLSGHTAPAGEHLGEEPSALPVALLAVGTRWVVARLWAPSEAASLLLMTELHRRLARGVEPPAALAGAQRWLRSLSRTEVRGLTEPIVLSGSAAAAPAAPAPGRLELPGGPHPFADPRQWAAFACFGAGAVR